MIRTAGRIGVLAVGFMAACSKAPPSASVPFPAAPVVTTMPEPSVATPRIAQPRCDENTEPVLFTSPHQAWHGGPLRVVAVSETPMEAELTLTVTGGIAVASSKEAHGGPPYWWIVEIAAAEGASYHISFTRSCKESHREVVVVDRAPPNPRATWGTVWGIKAEWNRTTENLYSAWLEKLFDAPLDVQLSWPALHEVLRDKGRNFLFNHLGIGEDEAGLVIRPDCADLPYFLRAYFAYKIGLPFGYSSCTRGGGGQAPTCPVWAHNQDPAAAKRPGSAQGFGYFVRYTLADAVHSGSARAGAEDAKTDHYPVPLRADTLRPGTIFADPYGHVLMLVKRLAQTNDDAGVLLAVDGQPDGTVARKRFWRGNFLFAVDPSLGSPGFKRFRPVLRGKHGGLRRMTNAEILASREYGDFSLSQYDGGVEGFYDTMDDVLSPLPLDPRRAMGEAIVALEEQVKTRVVSVENGRKYQAGGRGWVEMPQGASIFETTGAWEDFSTPSRDLRLLIAIDVVRGFPDRVARRPERYAMPAGKTVGEVRSELDAALKTELEARKVSYKRSDESLFALSLSDVVARASELEMAYNPNDCVELRWGAPVGSEENSTCKRHASAGQRAKMTRYRPWFHERRRPPRD